MTDTLRNEYHDQEASERLSKIHEERTSAPQTLTAFIKDGIGKSVTGFERVVKGEVNEVYVVHLTHGEDVVLRISHGDSNAHNKQNKFEIEAWALEQVAKQGVPVAKTLAVGAGENAKGPLYYAIQEKLIGRTFDNLLYLDHIGPAEARDLTEHAGEILAHIHGVKTKGYGRINKYGTGRDTTANEYMHHRTDEVNALKELFRQMGLSADLLDRVIDELGKADLIFEDQPHLVHSDYAPKHLFTNDGKITGVIDFEDVKSGDSTIDFSGWKFWFDNEAPLDWLLAGYKRISPLGDNFEERLKVSRLYSALGTMHYYANTAPYPKWAETSADVIKNLMAQE